MSKFAFTAVLAVALGFATVDDARAQYIVNSGYSQGYYGGYSPGFYYGNGGVIQSGGSGYYYNNNYSYRTPPIYNYGNYPSYPSYSGYSSNYSPALQQYYNFYQRGAAGNNYNYGRRWR